MRAKLCAGKIGIDSSIQAQGPGDFMRRKRRSYGNSDSFFVHTLQAAGVMAIILFVLRISLDHVIDTTSMQKLFLSGILMALAKLLIELSIGITTFLVAARLLKMEEMNSGLVRRTLNLLRIPWL